MTSLTRRRFLATTGVTAGAVLAGPHFLRRVSAQASGPIKIGFPLPLTGPFGAIAADQKRGAELAVDEINAKGGVMGRKFEVLFRDDELKPATGAQRTKELIEGQGVDFVVGGLAAHVQMAINEQTKKAGKLFISISQSDEISAKPDTSAITFHEALNPTITGRVVGSWALQNLGKKYWIVYADYAWGKQNNAVFTDVITKGGGQVLGSTPYPLGKPEFSAHLPKIQAAKPEVLLGAVPGADGVSFLKQVGSFGMKKEMKLLMPLHFLFLAKEGGADVFADVYAGTSFYWELGSSNANAKKFVDASMKKFNVPPDGYAGYGYSGILEVARGVELAKSTDSEAVAKALRASPNYDHYKGKQFWRACDNKAFQDMWILKGRPAAQVKGDWGYFDTVARVAADERHDRTCAEKGHV
jgi:branched-chain amino acid transport system substrate-binding protein